MDAGYTFEVVSCLLLVLAYSLRLVYLLMP
jgi:hypothetical protein